MNNKNFKKRDIGPKVIANDRIRAKTVRVSFPDGTSQILSLGDALHNANKLELDLVLITETADPPVTKITDLAKYIYASKQKDWLAHCCLVASLSALRPLLGSQYPFVSHRSHL